MIMCFCVLCKYIVPVKVDLLTVAASELHARLLKFGSKRAGPTFQEASMDPSLRDYVLKWMESKSFEEQLFQKYTKLALEDFKPTAKASLAKFQ